MSAASATAAAEGAFRPGYGRPPRDKAFKKGQSGNPLGRPKVPPLLHIKSREVDTYLHMNVMEIAEHVVKQAKAGSLKAAALVLERVMPPARAKTHAPIKADLTTSDGIVDGLTNLANAALAGDLAPDDATRLAALMATVYQARVAQQAQQLTDLVEKLQKLADAPTVVDGRALLVDPATITQDKPDAPQT